MTKKNKEQQPKPRAMSLKLPTDAGGFQLQAIILILIGFIFYSNSFFNEYALDDGIVIQKNEYVQDGFKGIKNKKHNWQYGIVNTVL